MASVSRRIGRFIARGMLFAFGLVAVLLLWLQIHGLPAFATKWIEDGLSEGRFACRFNNARLTFDGIELENVRVHIKHDTSHSFLTAKHICFLFRLRPSKPLASWIYFVSADGLICNDIPDGGDAEANFFAKSCRDIGFIMDHPVGISIRDSEIMSVKFDDFSGTLSVDADGVVLDRVVLTLCSEPFEEKLRGMLAISAPDSVLNAHIEGTITPDKIEQLTLDLEGDTAVEYYHWLSRYTSPLNIVGDIRYELSESGGKRHVQDMRVSINGTNLDCKEISVDRFNIGIAWKVTEADKSGSQNRSLSLAPIYFNFSDGTVDGSITWHPITHATDVKATSTVSINTMARILNVDIPECTTNLSFATMPVVTVDGTIYGGDFRGQSLLNGRLHCDKATAYGIDFTRLTADFGYAGMDRLDVSNIVATSHGGSITGRVDAAFEESAVEYSLDLGIHNVDFGEVRRHVSGAYKPGGIVNSRLVLNGYSGTNGTDSLLGTYKGSVRNSNLLRIPLFAGLTDFMGRNVPGVDDILMQTDADFDCTITNGVIGIDNLSVEGNVFSMAITGKIDIDTPRTPVDLTTQVRFFRQKTLAGKLARLVFLPVSKFMEFRVSGPIDDPEWNYIGLIDRIKGLWSSDEPGDAAVRDNDSEEKVELK